MDDTTKALLRKISALVVRAGDELWTAENLAITERKALTETGIDEFDLTSLKGEVYALSDRIEAALCNEETS